MPGHTVFGSSVIASSSDGVAPSFAVLTLSAPTLTAFSGGSVKITAPSLSLLGGSGATARLTLPAPILYAGAPPNMGTSTIILPSPTLAAFAGGLFTPTLPSTQLAATGHNSLGDNSFTGMAPSLSLSAFAGANAAMTLPTAALSVTATFVGSGSAALALPTATLTASGTITAMATAAFSVPTATLIGYSGAVLRVTLNDGVTLAAAGSAGSVGTGAVTVPMFDLVASGTVRGPSYASLLAPAARMGATAQAWIVAPGATLMATGHAVVTATYEAYAVNLNHRDPASNNQVTRYTNYPFDRIVRYKNSYFGMNSTGLYLLEGTTDNATPIPYEVKTHVTDFDATEQKTVVSAYMGGRMGAAETVTLFAGEKTSNAYPYTTPRGATPQNYRQKFGRGIKARYYGIGFKGDKEFDLDTLELEINKLPRRI